MKNLKKRKNLHKSGKNSLVTKRHNQKPVVRHTTEIQQYSGPLPPPDFLERYERVLPGCADRLVAMAEELATHGREYENKALSLYASENKRGQYLVFALSLTCILAGAVLTAFVNVYAGGAFGLLGIVFLVSQVLGKFINYLSKK